MGGLVGLLGPAIPAIAKQLGVEDTELGWAFSVRAGGYIIGSLITSRLPERCVVYIYIRIYIYIYMCVCVCVCMCAIYIYICIYMHIYAYICIYMHVWV